MRVFIVYANSVFAVYVSPTFQPDTAIAQHRCTLRSLNSRYALAESMGKSNPGGPVALSALRSHPKYALPSDPRHMTSDAKVYHKDEKAYTTAELWDVAELRSTAGSDSTMVDIHNAQSDLETGSRVETGANKGAVAHDAAWARDLGGEDARRAAVRVTAPGWPGGVGYGEGGKVLDIA